jgi:prepilin-type N-terminal cleavage/methylation domain-containing protein
MKRREFGYSLVEVLIALAITSIVLLTVVTLFYMGRRNVYSGKQMTYAVSVGTRILEDLSNWVSGDVLSNFNIDDTTAIGPVTVSGITYDNSLLRDTSGCTGSAAPYTCPNDVNGYLASYRALIDESKLTNGRVGLILTPRSPSNLPVINCPGGNCPWTTARFLKIRVYIQWDEAKNRTRIAFFDTTKINRE